MLTLLLFSYFNIINFTDEKSETQRAQLSCVGGIPLTKRCVSALWRKALARSCRGGELVLKIGHINGVNALFFPH